MNIDEALQETKDHLEEKYGAPLAEAKARQLNFQHEDAGGYGADEEAAQAQAAAAAAQGGYVQSAPQTVHREGPKVGRNDPCPCGSGKKYKHCHGQLG